MTDILPAIFYALSLLCAGVMAVGLFAFKWGTSKWTDDDARFVQFVTIMWILFYICARIS
ncbi:MAG: hypothetical protein QQN63_06850 [Nitrosopumilus sp.]